jgi:hypothetical protein
LIPLIIVAAGAAWLVERQTNQSKSSITIEVPRMESEWCQEESRSRRGWYCEVREFTFDAAGSVEFDASPNGGIEVEGWDGNEIHVQAKVQGQARSDGAAYELVSEVQIAMGSELKASGPKTGRGESWSVSYRAKVPRQLDLALNAMNGSIAIQDVSGSLEMSTVNGGISLGQLAGDVSARTVNGGIKAQLSGSAWEGSGLELRTTNGAIEIGLPSEYNAVLEAATTNGGVQVDFPVTVTGRIGKRLNTVLGEGGATISATTTNGAVKIRKN